MMTYRPNPFLEILTEIIGSDAYLRLGQYARIMVDFFDLLNVPLLNAVKSGQKIVDTKVEFLKYQPSRCFVKAFFEGLVYVKLTTETGQCFETYLPVNKHAAAKIKGYDRARKERIIDRHGFPHHTIPLKWSLFDIVESCEYAKKRRQSRWDKNPTECIYIHFDNSFKILHYVDYTQYLVFKKPFEKLLEKVWSKKVQSCQYVEVSDFETLQRLFTLRFVEGKRRRELFDSLELKCSKQKCLSGEKLID
jgi:hypothetical protein